jgi:hypothetical protein
MIMIQRIHEIIDFCIRQTRSVENLEPFLRRFRHSDFFNPRLENISMLDSRGIDSEPFIVDPLRFP